MNRRNCNDHYTCRLRRSSDSQINYPFNSNSNLICHLFFPVSISGGCLHYAKKTEKNRYISLGHINLRKQKCTISREEGRKISICVRDGGKLLTKKSSANLGNHSGRFSFRNKEKKTGSHSMLVFRAPSEGVADLWSAWMEAAATHGNGGAEDTGIVHRELEVKHDRNENWQMLVRLPGIVGARRSGKCVQQFQEALALIAAQNAKRIKEETSHLSGHSESRDHAKADYPSSPIFIDADQTDVETVASSSNSEYDCDSGEESSIIAL